MRTGSSTSGATAEPSRLATDLDWLDLQARTLCVHDEVGRLLRWNGQPGEDMTAPAFFFGRTPVGNLWRLRADLPDALVRELARLAAAERTSDELPADPERLPAIMERLESWAPVHRTWRGPAFRFPPQLPAPETDVVWLEGGELAGLGEAFPQLVDTWRSRAPCAALLEKGRVVSACYAATAPVPGGGVEAGVDTVAAQRGRGLAGRGVIAWVHEIRRRGLTPLYSTSWDNRSSRALAHKLGLVPFGSDLSLYV